MYFVDIGPINYRYSIRYASGQTLPEAVENGLIARLPTAESYIKGLPSGDLTDDSIKLVDYGNLIDFRIGQGELGKYPILDINKSDLVLVKCRQLFDDYFYWQTVDLEYKPTAKELLDHQILLFRPNIIKAVQQKFAKAFAVAVKKDKSITTLQDLFMAFYIYIQGMNDSTTFRDLMQMYGDAPYTINLFSEDQGVKGLKFDGLNWIIKPFSPYPIQIQIFNIKPAESIVLMKYLNTLSKIDNVQAFYKLLGVDKYHTTIGG